MKLLFVHERIGALGGAESNALITAAELARRNHLVGLLHGPGTGRDERLWGEVFSKRFSIERTDPSAVISQALDDFDPDLIYVHKMADLSVIEALIKSRRPLVRMVHDHDIYCMKSYKYAYLSRRICHRPVGLHCLIPCGAFLARNRAGRWPLRYVSYLDKKREVQLNRQFHRMVVVSDYMRKELLHNGFDDSRIDVLAPVPRDNDWQLQSTFSDRNLIVFAGQIIRGKGVDVLLEALSMVKCPFECIILGEGTHRAACEKLSQKLGLSTRVSFKGFVPQERLKEYYGECCLVVLSSVWPEPIATIGLEAMRCALPVVAFDAGGIRDWLQDGVNGFLVRWMNKAEFANRVERLLQDKALAKACGERGRKIAEERFGFTRYIDNLETLFSDVILNHRRI